MIGIIDYGAGNILSVRNALEYLGMKCFVIASAEDIDHANRIVLPGVGSFQYAIKQLEERNLMKPIKEWIESGKPFLGVCLGMQILFEESEEAKDVKGMKIFKGKAKKFRKGKVPQIGWNQVKFVRKNRLFEDIKDNSFFYFLHSYYLPINREITTGITEYGITYASIVGYDNVQAVQFHPEKSGKVGLKMLHNWVRRC